MVQRAIRESDGKQLLLQFFSQQYKNLNADIIQPCLLISPDMELSSLGEIYPWLTKSPLVVKPDHLVKRRGKLGLVKLNASWNEVCEWIKEKRHEKLCVGSVTGELTHFIVEPFVAHSDADEVYVAIRTTPEGDEVLFHHQGGVDVGDVDEKAVRYMVGPLDRLTEAAAMEHLIMKVPQQKKAHLAAFLQQLHHAFCSLHFAYLEINPLVVRSDQQVFLLDLAAKLDSDAEYLMYGYWGNIVFPTPFGRPDLEEERYVKELDAKTGASLKLTVLNPKGRIWLMVAGGGASVIYTDTIADLQYGHELANYGEYSGDPTEQLTYEYAKTILSLMTKQPNPQGKILLIGGGVANFTDVAETFKGIIRAITEKAQILLDHKVRIYVRRGGPNYQQGLQMMEALGKKTMLPIHVFGPETHLTAIIPMAINNNLAAIEGDEDDSVQPIAPHHPPTAASLPSLPPPPPSSSIHESKPLFTADTQCIIFGLQPRAVQSMLDFDFLCKRTAPSVAAIIYPFGSAHAHKFYWGASEVFVPVFNDVFSAAKKFPNVDTVVNFSSFRAVQESMDAIFELPQIRCVAIIAEGVPERISRSLVTIARQKGVTIIGPATVGGVKCGCFRIGNAGGMMDNVVRCKLYRPGSVGYVTRSGGLSNELNNIISRVTDGVYEGIAIGGDRFPGSSFLDHLLRYEACDDVKMMVVLGEVGGNEEYKICQAIRDGQLKKPIVVWCTGTCAKLFPYDVQFGHAGALANAHVETAEAKNASLRAAGCIVPPSFNEFKSCIRNEFRRLVEAGVIVPAKEPVVPNIPMDFDWARRLGLVRKPASFVCSISDDRGEEVSYGNIPISNIIQDNMGIGGVIGLLWFRKKLPPYACQFIEMILMLTADHGPAVSGAHNTIVAARAGKDLVSSVCSGLLTIGPRFGGAIDAAAQVFSDAFDAGKTPREFVEEMRNSKQLIPGIGHRVKSLENPDMRVVILKKFARDHFPSTGLLDFAEKVEQITTRKRSNLILNVDGCIGACFIDMISSSPAFSKEEVKSLKSLGALNGLFVLGRTIGLVGHFLDQNRMQQGLYRHPTDDITFLKD